MRSITRFSLALVLGVVAAGAAAPAEARAPRSFFGMIAWSLPDQSEFEAMADAGTGVYRTQLSWYNIEPNRAGEQNWADFDETVRRAAKAGLTVLPTMFGSPSFISSDALEPPIDTQEARDGWDRFLRDAVDRYGPGGVFWQANQDLTARPIRMWQIWNEPNFPAYWSKKPNAAEYVGLVARSHDAIVSRDPGAKIAIAGIPQTRFPGSLSMSGFIKRLYRVKGVRSKFDALAVHPYAANHEGVIGAVRRVREIMARGGDRRKPILLTEVGWATGGNVTGGTRRFKTSPKGQASRLRKTYRSMLRTRRRYRVSLVVWFSWRDRAPFSDEPNWWAIHTGLFTRSGQAKPAWRTYRRIARKG